MYNLILIFLFFYSFLNASEPITPIPLTVDYNKEKALLGKMLFEETQLSEDNSTSCASCHNLYYGGADSRVVSLGYANRKGRIQSPTVFNARYNFAQFWNGRTKNLSEHVSFPFKDPAEHNIGEELIEKRMNASKVYKGRFKNVYNVDYISYQLVLDAIVEFEKTLITPNAKFDKFLRGEVELTKEEAKGYKLFKHYGCITCHNGINIGANSFQKFGTFVEYNSDLQYPDRSAITNSKLDQNVFKVPTLRNIYLTAPYFHDGNAKNLQDAIKKMAVHNLGFEISQEDTLYIEAFLKSLSGEKPKILDHQ